MEKKCALPKVIPSKRQFAMRTSIIRWKERNISMFFVWFAVFHRHFLDLCTSTAISPAFTFTFSAAKNQAECRRIKHSLRARDTNELLCPFELPASKKENLVATMLPVVCRKTNGALKSTPYHPRAPLYAFSINLHFRLRTNVKLFTICMGWSILCQGK